MPVQEITNFKSGIDLSLDPFLAPPDAFVNLRNGYVHRGVVRSRKGLRGFATGTTPSNRLVSRLSDEITNETADTGDGSSDYSFTLANTQIERSLVTVNAPTEALTITFTYDADTKTTVVAGDTGGGTNNINYDTGAMNVSFSGNIGGGNDINVTYQYHPDVAVMGIHEYLNTGAARDLIVCDRSFPYIYDGASNDFDRISFAGGVGPFTGSTSAFFSFQNWRLHSTGAVPAAAGALSLSDVLFMTNNTDAPFVYDGTNVDLVSNMAEFREPAEGSLDTALHVVSYGERLCWLRPTLGGEEFGQAVLWGPINDSGGLALDYQGPGSGILSAATNSVITGIHFLRDTLIVFFENQVYALELTDDPFAPFRWTKLEDERGIESPFAAVGQLGFVEGLGRQGILATDARRTSRSDNRIPDFTRDEIDPVLIAHVFGEEMDENSQYWFTYPATESIDITTSNKVLVKNYEETNFSIYDLAISVLNKTILGDNTVWDNLPEAFGGDDLVDDNGDPVLNPFPTADVSWDLWGLQEQRYKTIEGDHHGFIFTVDKALNDGVVQISPQLSGGTPITLGSTTIIETEYHNFQVGDVVQIQNVQGTTELNGNQYNVISVPDQSSIEIDVNSTNFTAWTSDGEVVKPINFEAEFVPFNPARSEGQTVTLKKMDFLVKSGTGNYTIDFFEDRQNLPWSEQNNQSYTFSSGVDERRDRWFSLYVDQKADFHRWRIKQLQINNEIAIKSIRVFYELSGESNI